MTAASRLPTHGWMPEIPTGSHTLPAHYITPGSPLQPIVPGHAFPRGYQAPCGAWCLPIYGHDPCNRLARHPRCPSCTAESE
ncbi:hypothetical protein SAMN06265360_11836 [Haloechinothrix alba]|uniref:Uncharacterized protein n=1 Tax=Haloechinothrix alba TaxID=664784 RepID=A0A238Z133_9PSEU|nr:hypothetical protein SAMN06265360_11836 [Haloechinothrix alba]